MNINPPNPPTKNSIKYKYKCPPPPGSAPPAPIMPFWREQCSGTKEAWMQWNTLCRHCFYPPLPPPLTFNISLCFGKHGRMIIAVFVFCSGIIADLKHCQMAYVEVSQKPYTKVPKSKILNMHLTNFFRCIVSLREFCALCDSYIDGYVKSSWRC